jgi:hypothetical protein
MVEGRNTHRVLVQKLEEKRHLARPRRRWECNTKEIELVSVEWWFAWLRIWTSGGLLRTRH